ncbi:YncE family protein [Polyangium fumosum]|uniref:YncE family protein n=1 Tax=Polyangium fumosum TaxID=889272 RepID=A0A4U1IU06_9BACT|nr:hypothetical protein [Polyangium fumosum]TKC97887.1 hypothetical protein E8A74_43650 [Polyangium fumosum]
METNSVVQWGRRRLLCLRALAEQHALVLWLASWLLHTGGCARQDPKEKPSLPAAAGESAGAPSAPVSVEVTDNGLTMAWSATFEDGATNAVGAWRVARARLSVKDAATGAAQVGLRPRVWLSARKEGGTALDHEACRNLVASFAGGLLSAQPASVLDGYLVLALNEDPSLSIIEPRVALARTKLQSLVALPGQAADWAAAPQGTSVFVTIPERDLIAEVDVLRGRVRGSQDVGDHPTRIVPRGDARSFWVGNDGDGTVSVIDADARAKRKTLGSGAGHQEIVFLAGGRRAWVSASDSETMKVFDAEHGELLAEVNVGRGVVALAGSDEAAMILAARDHGELVVVDEASRAVTRRIPVARGGASVAFAPGGRFAWLAQREAGVVHVFDASQGKIVQTTRRLSRPDHVSFTRNFVYVRELGSSHLSMFGLAGDPANEPPKLVQVAMGQAAPDGDFAPSFAAPMAPLPEGGGMLVAHPVDRTLYGYAEGMMAPIATHPAYGRSPRAVRIVDRSLHEIEPGVYEAPFRMDGGGVHDVAVQIDGPRKVTACLEGSLPDGESRPGEDAFGIEPLFDPGEKLVAGQATTLRFRLREPIAPRALTALFTQDPTGYVWRGVPKAEGDSVYAITVKPSTPGRYRLVVRPNQKAGPLMRRATWTLGVRAGDAEVLPASEGGKGGRK